MRVCKVDAWNILVAGDACDGRWYVYDGAGKLWFMGLRESGVTFDAGFTRGICGFFFREM